MIWAHHIRKDKRRFDTVLKTLVHKKIVDSPSYVSFTSATPHTPPGVLIRLIVKHSKGIDISAEDVNNALALAKESNVLIQAEVVDLESDFIIKQGYYDVIICFNYLQRSRIPQIKGGLRPGGVIVYETFIIDQATLFGKPRNPDFLLKHNELLDMFRDFRCLRYREGIIEGQKAVASIIAEKI